MHLKPAACAKPDVSVPHHPKPMRPGHTGPLAMTATLASQTAAASRRDRPRASHIAHHAAMAVAASHRGGGTSVHAAHGARSTSAALSTMPAAAPRPG